MSLEKRRLGTTDMSLTTVGIGTFAMGGGNYRYSWGPQDDQRSIDTIRYAVEHGVNWLDSAPIYGLGHAEEVVGRALRDIPAADRPYVFTKAGMVFDPSKPFEDPEFNLRPESLRRELEDSLRRLKVECIDIYMLHWPDRIGTRLEDSWAQMVRFIDEGKVRAVGVSNFTVELLESCEAIRHVDMLQPPLSLIRREAGADVIPWCDAHGTGVVVYQPLQAGILTDTMSAELLASFTGEDLRRPQPEFQEPNFSRELALRDALRPIAGRYRSTVVAVAVGWTLAWPGVTGAIVGARSPQEVDGYAELGSLHLTPQDLAEIAEAIVSTQAGGGPAAPAAPAHSGAK
ncbi:MAG: aldo/keto reductase [Candidatus Dormibacteria bacterium]